MTLKNNNTKTINIKNVDDLIKLGESNVLTPKQFTQVLESCNTFIGIFLNDYENTIEMAKELKAFWSKWKNAIEKPIFIDNDY
jgi:hypothetical protein